MPITIQLRGACPSKKNCYEIVQRPDKHGKMRPSLAIKPDAAAKIAALQLEANAACRRLGIDTPLEHPGMEIEFWSSTLEIDRDGMKTTILDILQEAKIIKKDNIRYFNGMSANLPAQLCQPGDEKVRIWLEPKLGGN